MFKAVLSHRQMLADKVKMTAYRKAIHEAVRKGDVVADIGTGSGILAYFAIKAGAKKVYAIEQGEIIEEAENLAKINGFKKKIVFIKNRSDRVNLPERVDVIISEVIGCFGLGEMLPMVMIDARRRFLKPGGKLVPSWLELYLVPVESKAIWKDCMEFWSKNFYGIDFSTVKNSVISRTYIMDCSNKIEKLASPSVISYFNFFEFEKTPLVFKTRFVIGKKKIFHGLVGYFRVSLSQNVVLTTSPEKPLTHWKQIFFPLENTVMTKAGDKVYCEIKTILRNDNLFWQWDTSVYRNGVKIAEFSQSDLNVTKKDLIMGREDFRPVLIRESGIYRRIFELCDGSRTVEEIAGILRREYSEKYKDIDCARQDVVRSIRGKVMIK